MLASRVTRHQRTIQQMFKAQPLMLAAQNMQTMSYMTTTKQAQFKQPMFNSNMFALRYFSGLPDHTKLEMPNLSPTMEKVSFQALNLLGQHQEMEPEGRR